MTASQQELLRGEIGLDRNVDGGEIGLRPPVPGEGLQGIVRSHSGIGQHVGTGPNVMGSQVRLRIVVAGVLTQRGGTHHLGAIGGGQVVQEGRVALLEGDGDGVVTFGGHRRHIGDHVRWALVNGEPAVEGCLDGGRRERRPIVEQDTPTELEGVDPLVGRDAPAGRQEADDPRGRRPRLVLQQALVSVGGQQQTLAGVVDVGIRWLTGILEEAHMEHPVGGGLGRRARGVAPTGGRAEDDGGHERHRRQRTTGVHPHRAAPEATDDEENGKDAKASTTSRVVRRAPA